MINRYLRRLRRFLYGLRAYVPWLRERHRMEAMIGPVGFWDELQRYQLCALQARGILPRHSLLDLGCGPLQGGIALIRYLEADRYAGVDLRPDHLDAGYRQIGRLGLAAKNPRLIASATFGDDLLDAATFDYIWASQILYYFDEAKMAAVLSFVRRRLRPAGRFLGDILDPDRFESLLYPRCGFLRHTVEDMVRRAAAHDLRVAVVGRLMDFHYPRQLRLHGSLLLEFTPAR